MFPGTSLINDLGLAAAAAVDDGNPSGAATRMEGGRVRFENASYAITVSDNDTILVANLASGEQYLAFGPPQLATDGVHAFDFWGTTTLELEDGTKLTITTVPWADDPLVTVSDKLTITNSDYGVEVLGLSARVAGDLRFVETQRYGWLLDAAVGDGNLIEENDDGAGFVGDNASGVWQAVDQDYIDATDLALLGPLAGERGSPFVSLTGLLEISWVGTYRGPMAYRFSELEEDPQAASARHDDPQRAALRVRARRDGHGLQWQVDAGAHPSSGRSGLAPGGLAALLSAARNRP